MEAIVTARRVTMRDAKRHFDGGGKVVVSERGHEPTYPVGRQTTTHSRETTTWEGLTSQVREWRGRYPNQRFYLVPEHELVTTADDKYPHLVTGWCEACNWRFSGSAREFVVKQSFEQQHTA